MVDLFLFFKLFHILCQFLILLFFFVFLFFFIFSIIFSIFGTKLIKYNSSTEIIWTGRVGRFPVNSVEISQSLSGNIYLVVSTNDKEVKGFIPLFNFQKKKHKNS